MENMIKQSKKSLLIISVLILASCFDSDKETMTSESKQPYESSNSEALLADNQIKTVQYNARALLKSRKIRQDRQLEDSKKNKEYLQEIQKIIQNLETEMSKLHYTPAYSWHSTEAASLVVKSIPQLKFNNTQKQKTKKESDLSKTVSGIADVNKVDATRKVQYLIQSSRSSIESIKSRLNIETKKELSSIFKTKKQINYGEDSDTNQRNILREKLTQIDNVLAEVESDNANALQKVKLLNGKLKLQLPELNMKNTTPTITFLHSSDNKEK